MSGFVQFDEAHAEVSTASLLRDLGFLESDAVWLGDFLEHQDFFDLTYDSKSSEADNQRQVFKSECIEDLRTCLQRNHESRDALMVDVVQGLMGLGEQYRNKVPHTGPWVLFPELRVLKKSWSDKLSMLNIDWVSGIRRASEKISIRPEYAAAVARGLGPDRFKWVDVLDREALSTANSIDELLTDLHRNDEDRNRLISDPSKLEFWLVVVGLCGWTDALKLLPLLFVDKTEEQKEQVSNGILRSCLVYESWCRGPVGNAPPVWIAAINSTLIHLEETAPEVLFSKSASGGARYAWMHLRYEIDLRDDGTFDPETLVFTPPSTQKRLLEVAHEALGISHEMLGKVRSALREDDPDKARIEYTRYQFHIAVDIVDKLGDPWRATKAALLAFRELRFLSVGSDLRYWPEHGKDNPPFPWSEIPWLVAEQFRVHRRARPTDDRMEEVRGQFARFLLERLKTVAVEGASEEKDPVGQKTTFVEQDPVWRSAYTRALRELYSNPGGRGHHVLHWLSKNDPDEDVRQQAALTYKKMRKNESLPVGTSPLTALLAAFWWLRQAHVVALGGTVDQAGASRTRAKEVRRTT